MESADEPRHSTPFRLGVHERMTEAERALWAIPIPWYERAGIALVMVWVFVRGIGGSYRQLYRLGERAWREAKQRE